MHDFQSNRAEQERFRLIQAAVKSNRGYFRSDSQDKVNNTPRFCNKGFQEFLTYKDNAMIKLSSGAVLMPSDGAMRFPSITVRASSSPLPSNKVNASQNSGGRSEGRVWPDPCREALDSRRPLCPRRRFGPETLGGWPALRRWIPAGPVGNRGKWRCHVPGAASRTSRH